MISVQHFKRSDTEAFTRISNTLLCGQYYEPHGTLQFRLLRTVNNEETPYLGEPHDIFVAYYEGKIAGYMVWIPRRNGVEFYVADRYRRKGVGTALVCALRKITGLTTLCGDKGFPGYEHFYARHHIFINNGPAIERTMKEIEPRMGQWNVDVDFLKLYNKARRRVKLRLHHMLRKELANATS